MNGWLFNQNAVPKIPTPPATARPLQCDPAAFPSPFQHAQGRSGGSVWMQFKTRSWTCSSSFPVLLHFQPHQLLPSLSSLVPHSLSPVPGPAPHLQMLLAPLVCFKRFLPVPYQLVFTGSAFIAVWHTPALGHTFNYLWTISIYSGFALFPFSFTEHCLYFLRAFSTATQSVCVLAACLLACFFFLFTFSVFSLSSLTKLWWPFLHCCPLCKFALKRVQV